MIATQCGSFQIPLIEFVESDDLHFELQVDMLWFYLLRNLDWPPFRGSSGLENALLTLRREREPPTFARFGANRVLRLRKTEGTRYDFWDLGRCSSSGESGHSGYR
jgi:hypothetical protein